MGVSNKVQESGMVLGALGVIGMIGIIWLMIYGNLSGNMGFAQTSSAFVNDTTRLISAGNIPPNAQNRTNAVLSNVIVINATNFTFPALSTGNYTTSGRFLYFAAAGEIGYNNTLVNVSYTVTYADTTEVESEDLITNMTDGYTTFFGFSDTFLTIAAIMLLILMLLGVLAIVLYVSRGFSNKPQGKFAG